MVIENNYSITQLFVRKEVKIIIDKKQFFTLKLPVIRDLFDDEK